MAIASEDRLQVWSAQTAIELRQKALMYNLLDHSWEAPWVAGAESVTIPIPDFVHNTTPTPDEGVNASSRARGADWADAQNLDSDVVKLTRSGGFSTANQVLWEDALELPWDAVGRTRSRQVYALRRQIDTAMYTAARAAAGTTITTGAAGATFVSRTAPYTYTLAAGVRHPVLTAIEAFALVAYRANVIDGEGSPTGGAGRPFIILPPELSMSLSQYMETQGIHFDPLSSELLKENPAAMAGQYMGNLRGVSVYSWNAIAVPTGTNNWTAYAGVREAMAVGIRPPIVQYFPPETNQVSDNPQHLMRQAGDYGIIEVMDGLHRKIVVHAD